VEQLKKIVMIRTVPKILIRLVVFCFFIFSELQGT